VARLELDAGRTPVLFDVAPNRRALADFVDLDKCVVVRGDLLNPLELVGAVKANGVDRIAHTAAYPNLTLGGLVAPLASIQVNILGTAHVLETARLLDLERVVVCSSSAMYVTTGGEDQGIINKEEAWPRPGSIYAATKQAAENLALNYTSSFGLLTRCLRFATVFGPWASGGGGAGTTAMEDIARAARRGETLEVDPTPREWLYSKDAALAVHLACWNDLEGAAVFNIGPGVSIPGEDLAKAVAEVFPGSTVNVAAASASATMATVMPAMDPTRAREVLAFTPQFDIKGAFVDYRDWLDNAPSQK
jgi:UDP-glucose 4-epimerase